MQLKCAFAIKTHIWNCMLIVSLKLPCRFLICKEKQCIRKIQNDFRRLDTTVCVLNSVPCIGETLKFYNRHRIRKFCEWEALISKAELQIGIFV